MSLNLLRLIVLLLLVTGCSKQSGFKPLIDTNNPYLPVWRFAFTNERETAFRESRQQNIAALFMVTNEQISAVPVSTSLSLNEDTFIMQPLIPLDENLTFEWQLYDGNDTLKLRFTTPSKKTSNGNALITEMWPKSDTIPANILLFHVFFSEPMVENPLAYKEVSITHKKSAPAQFAWREKASWSDNGRQLTLMIHPGRIKREIMYSKSYGSLFIKGQTYDINISNNIKTISGKPITPFTKSYYISAIDRTLPRCLGIVSAPHIMSKDSLFIHFNEAMDYGSLQIGMRIINSKGSAVEGKYMAITDKLWCFIPNGHWRNESYLLTCDDYCSDLSSNHLNRPFEVNQIEGINRAANIIEFKPR